MRMPPKGCSERLKGMSVWSPTIFSSDLSKYPALWLATVETMEVSASYTPPRSRSFLEYSMTISQSFLVASVAGARKAPSPSYGV